MLKISMKKERIYWELPESSLKRKGNKILFKGMHFDAVDQKSYEAEAIFSLRAFRKGLQELQEHGAAYITDDPPKFAETIWMSRNVLTKNIDMLVIGKFSPFRGAGFRHSLPQKDLLD